MVALQRKDCWERVRRTRCGRMERLDEHGGWISFMEALGEETRRCPMGCTASDLCSVL